MPRPRGRRPNIDVGPLVKAATGGPEQINYPSPDQAGLMAQDYSGASDMGSTYGLDGSSPKIDAGIGTPTPQYPRYKQPGFWSRLVNPEGANQAAQFNYQSQFKEASDAAGLRSQTHGTNEAMRLKDYELLKSSAREVLGREGLTPERIEIILDQIGQTKVNQAKINAIQSDVQLGVAQNEPDIFGSEFKAKTLRPMYENKSMDANTQAQLINNQTLDARNQLGLETGKIGNQVAQQNLTQDKELFPFRRQMEANKAFQSQMIPLQDNTIYGNVPTLGPTGQPIEFMGVSGPQRPTPAQTVYDPNNGMRVIDAKPAVPPMMYPVQRPGVGETNTTPSTPNSEPFRLQMPDGSIKVFRPRNPQTPR